MTLAERIIQCRKRSGMTQEELGEKLGVSRQAVSKWESGQTTPDLQYLKEMCALFHITADWLLFGEGGTETARGDEALQLPGMDTCPKCGEQVVCGAAFCPKCGQSLAPLDRPGCYTLVLNERAVGNTAVYDKLMNLYKKPYAAKELPQPVSRSKAAEIADSAPVILCRNLDGAQVKEVLGVFWEWENSKILEIYRDETGTKTLEELRQSGLVPLTASAFQEKASDGIGFWGVVGAVIVALLILSFL